MTTRYRCAACGNVTRFDVVSSRRTRAFHHYSIGGDLEIEEEEVLAAEVESVTCRWCGADGDAISFGCEEYAISLPDIESYIGHKIPVERYQPESLPKLHAAPYVPRDPDAPRRRGGGGGGGGRPRSGGPRRGPPRRR